MSKQHKRWKGCCMMCAMNRGKILNAGMAERTDFKHLRKLGKKRRVSRHDLGLE